MKKRIVAIACVAAMASLALAGCGASGGDDAAQAGSAANEAVSVETTEDTAAAAPGEAAGFTETPVESDDAVFEDIEVGGLLNVSAVYFQPVSMSPGQEDIDAFDIHLEADVSALENNVGYELGSWIPYMTVDYEVTTEDGEVAAEGSFMEMNASDGPHYGANIALPDAGKYNLKFTFHSPEENGYLVHSDAETGPGGVLSDIWADGNLEVNFEGWNYGGPIEP